MDWLVYGSQPLGPGCSLVCGSPDAVTGLDLLVLRPAGLYDPKDRTPVCACDNSQLLVLPVARDAETGEALLQCVDSCPQGHLPRGSEGSSGQVCDPCTINHKFKNPNGPLMTDPNCVQCELGSNPLLLRDPSKCLDCKPPYLLNPDQGCVSNCSKTVNGDGQHHYYAAMSEDGAPICQRCTDFSNCNACPDGPDTCTDCGNNKVLLPMRNHA